MKYGNRPQWKRIVASPIALILLVIFLIVLVRATSRLTAKAESGSTRLAQAQAEYQKLEERKSDLSFKVTKLSTDEGLESEIRAKYRAVKEGESVAVIVDDEESTSTAVADSPTDVGFFHKMLRKFRWQL
jgi:cell division protein FtsB